MRSRPTRTPPRFKDVQPVHWEPRFGFAWDLFGNGKTVLRAMGGVYHCAAHRRRDDGRQPGQQPAPQNRTLTIDFGTIDNLANLDGTALDRPRR